MKVFLLTVEAAMQESGGGGYYQTTTLRFSSGEYNKDGMNWEPRLKQPSLFVKGASTGNILPNSTTSSFGESILINSDGGLDYLADYALDGRELLLQVYDDETDTLTNVASTTVSSISFSKTEVSLALRALHEALSQEHPQDEYKGDNALPDGLEGVATDIKGVRKPKVFGEVNNASPYMVNSAKLIYQVSSNPCEVTAVYDRGVLLEKEGEYTSSGDLQNGSSPAAGKFKSYEGYFRIGSSPTGAVTCDAGTSNKKLGDIFHAIVTEAGYTACQTCITDLGVWGDAGIYLKEVTTTKELLDKVADSSMSYWTMDSTGNIVMKRITMIGKTEYSPYITYLDDSKILDITRHSSGGGSNGVPIYKFVVKYDKIETVQNDLAGSVDDGRRVRMANEFREDVFTYTLQKKLRNLLAEEKDIETILKNESSASFLNGQYRGLLQKRRDSTDVKIRVEDIGDTDIGYHVQVSSKYLGYSGYNWRRMIVTGMTFNLRKQEVTLHLFG